MSRIIDLSRTVVLVPVLILSAVACNGGSDEGVSATLAAPVDTTTTVVGTTITAVTTTAAPATTVAPTLTPATTMAATTVPVTAVVTTAAVDTVPVTPAPTTVAPTTVPPTTVAPTTTAACRVAELNDVVRLGDCGDTVKFIQERLTVLGFPAPADGLFGPGTETAVKNFQSSRNLVPDGIVGPLTWDKLVEGGIGD
jgi:peptidoglycan hydrolase-like protein with peptidoglycan-binding domain